MRSILLVGEDELLLNTRAAILHTVGAETATCRCNAALGVLQERRFDLIVLCHSIPRDLCEALAETVHIRWPGTRILLVAAIRMCDSMNLLPEIDAVSSADPERLIGRTVELLGARPPRRAASDTRIRRAAGR